MEEIKCYKAINSTYINKIKHLNELDFFFFKKHELPN